MKSCAAEVWEGGQKVCFSFKADDLSDLPERGKLSDFEPPEMERLYGEAYVAYSNYRMRFTAALSGSSFTLQAPTSVTVTSWKDV